MRVALIAAIFFVSVSAGAVLAQSTGSGGASGSGGAALGGAPPPEAPGGNAPKKAPGLAPQSPTGDPGPTRQSRRSEPGAASSLPTARRSNDGYDDGFTACMAMWDAGATGMSKAAWTRTCDQTRVPPPPGNKR
jgi:hypothetical protein